MSPVFKVFVSSWSFGISSAIERGYNEEIHTLGVDRYRIECMEIICNWNFMNAERQIISWVWRVWRYHASFFRRRVRLGRMIFCFSIHTRINIIYVAAKISITLDKYECGKYSPIYNLQWPIFSSKIRWGRDIIQGSFPALHRVIE